MRVLVINSYAGSITLGASSLGCEIIGSYEDDNFFLDVQKANFPHLEYRSYRREWPDQDLSDTVVCAHPPCSAFSLMNNSPTAKGANSKAFRCTREVLEYAMKNRAAAIAVESVMGALMGAWDVHQEFADRHGYHCYRILENGCMFGAQWRERFWAVWVRDSASRRENLNIQIAPNFKTVGEIVTGHEDGPAPGNLDDLLERQKRRLVEEAGCTPEEMSFFFDVQDPPHPTMPLGSLLWEKKFKTPDAFPEEKGDVIYDYVGGFGGGGVVFLDPSGFCPVLLGQSHWYYNGRNLSESGFKRLMGFPVEYVFPEIPKNYRRNMRTGLSKGVMPPIAAWILEEIGAHLNMRPRNHHNGPVYQLECRPNAIADFRIRKQDWWKRHEALPPLRQHDEERFHARRLSQRG